MLNKNFKENYSKKILNDSNPEKLKFYMSGYKPSIKNFGILSTENPIETKETRKRKKERFKHELNAGFYFYKHINKNFLNIKNPFFIVNAYRDKLARDAIRYQQNFFINANVLGIGYIVFELWESLKTPVNIDSYKIVAQRKVYLTADMNEIYFEHIGYKFTIPFLKKSGESAKFKDDYLINKKKEKIFFDTDFTNEMVLEKYKNFYENISFKFLDNCGYTGYGCRGGLKQFFDYFDSDENNFIRYKKYQKEIKKMNENKNKN